MKRENVKPSLITYYTTRASLIHPMLAVTQINLAIYRITASPYVNHGVNIVLFYCLKTVEYFMRFSADDKSECNHCLCDLHQKADPKHALVVLGSTHLNWSYWNNHSSVLLRESQ